MKLVTLAVGTLSWWSWWFWQTQLGEIQWPLSWECWRRFVDLFSWEFPFRMSHAKTSKEHLKSRNFRLLFSAHKKRKKNNYNNTLTVNWNHETGLFVQSFPISSASLTFIKIKIILTGTVEKKYWKTWTSNKTQIFEKITRVFFSHPPQQKETFLSVFFRFWLLRSFWVGSVTPPGFVENVGRCSNVLSPRCPPPWLRQNFRRDLFAEVLKMNR